jgi:hypothetical protein
MQVVHLWKKPKFDSSAVEESFFQLQSYSANGKGIYPAGSRIALSNECCFPERNQVTQQLMACQEPGMIGKVASVGAEISPSYGQSWSFPSEVL